MASPTRSHQGCMPPRSISPKFLMVHGCSTAPGARKMDMARLAVQARCVSKAGNSEHYIRARCRNHRPMRVNAEQFALGILAVNNQTLLENMAYALDIGQQGSTPPCSFRRLRFSAPVSRWPATDDVLPVRPLQAGVRYGFRPCLRFVSSIAANYRQYLARYIAGTVGRGEKDIGGGDLFGLRRAFHGCLRTEFRHFRRFTI